MPAHRSARQSDSGAGVGSTSSGTPAPSFDRIYFDSEPLVKSRWPRISTQLVNVLTHARALGIRVFLPEATERELEAHWLRDAHSLAGDIAAHFREVVDPTGFSFPDLDALRADYRAKVRAVKEQWDLQSIPMPRRAIGEVFDRWVGESVIAQTRVAHLKDTAIYQSVIEHLEGQPGHVGTFISQDTHFDEEFLRRLTPAGVRVKLSTDLAPILTELQKGLRAELRREIDEDQHRAKAALEARRDDLERFINETLEVPENYLGYPRITGFQGAVVGDIIGALTTHLPEGQPPARVTISGQVAVELRLLIEGRIRLPDRKMKAGEQLTPQYYTWDVLAVPVAEERGEKGIVLVEATAALRDGYYEDIQFVSASLMAPVFASLFERTPAWTPDITNPLAVASAIERRVRKPKR